MAEKVLDLPAAVNLQQKSAATTSKNVFQDVDHRDVVDRMLTASHDRSNEVPDPVSSCVDDSTGCKSEILINHQSSDLVDNGNITNHPVPVIVNGYPVSTHKGMSIPASSSELITAGTISSNPAPVVGAHKHKLNNNPAIDKSTNGYIQGCISSDSDKIVLPHSLSDGNGLSKHIPTGDFEVNADKSCGNRQLPCSRDKHLSEVPAYCDTDPLVFSKNNSSDHKLKKNNDEVSVVVDELENVSLNKFRNQECVHLESVIKGISYIVYDSEKQMPDIMRLITKDLSEPYSIYTYRYFIHNWPKLCFLAVADGKYVGAIVCKLDVHKKMVRRGYIAMLAVDSEYRRRQIGSTLVTKAIQAMIRDDCDEVVLETEITNLGALHLYENLGFVRDKRLFRYYLNGVDALRLKLWLR